MTAQRRKGGKNGDEETKRLRDLETMSGGD